MEHKKPEVFSNDDKPQCSSSENNQPTSQPKKFSKHKDIDTLLHHLYIAHELASNEDLNVYSNAEINTRSMEGIVKSTMRDAFWTLFREQITEEPPKLDMAFEILSEIKQGLELVMTPNVTKLRDQVSEVLDLNTLRIQAERGAIDVMYYAKYIISVMAKICAPVRDKSVAALAKETDIIALFRGIVEILSLMKSDLLNFSLAVIKPDIMANHLAYERDTFRDYISATGATLPLTKKWLLAHYQPNKTKKEIVHEAFLDLLTWDEPDGTPETLFLDTERLRRLKLEYFRLTVSCTLVFLSLSLVPHGLISVEDKFKETLKSFIMIIMMEARNNLDVKELAKNIATELHAKIENRLKIKDESFKMELEFKFLQETIEQASLPDQKIRVLVCNRVINYLKTSLTVRSSEDTHFPPALNLFKNELNALRVLFESIVNHNLVVCMEHYEKLLPDTSELT